MTEYIRPPLDENRRLRELEVSVTHRCTLACKECGFLVPRQPLPHHSDVAESILGGLQQLARLEVAVSRLVLVGGEPTLAPTVIAQIGRWVRNSPLVDELEVVSNGLSPDRMTAETLSLVDRFVVSDYVGDAPLVEMWQTWAALVAPQTEIIRRRHTHWDQWTGDLRVSDSEAQELWRTCWYRKHCTTLERGRIFACSRIPKLGRDSEGLPLGPGTTFDELRDYLAAQDHLPSCADCVPLISNQVVAVAEQPDARMDKLIPRALRVLQTRINDASTQK